MYNTIQYNTHRQKILRKDIQKLQNGSTAPPTNPDEGTGLAGRRLSHGVDGDDAEGVSSPSVRPGTVQLESGCGSSLHGSHSLLPLGRLWISSRESGSRRPPEVAGRASQSRW